MAGTEAFEEAGGCSMCGEEILRIAVVETTDYVTFHDMPFTSVRVWEIAGNRRHVTREERFECVNGHSISPTRPCTAESGHRSGSDHRWQECPTYHEGE